MKNIRAVQNRKVNLVKAQQNIRARLPGKGKFTVTGFVKRDESERSERVIGDNDAGCVDADILQRFQDEMTECVVAELADKVRIRAEAAHHGNIVAHVPTRVCLQSRITERVNGYGIKINKQISCRNSF